VASAWLWLQGAPQHRDAVALRHSEAESGA
jgi:hypothetical protein